MPGVKKIYTPRKYELPIFTWFGDPVMITGIPFSRWLVKRYRSTLTVRVQFSRRVSARWVSTVGINKKFPFHVRWTAAARVPVLEKWDLNGRCSVWLYRDFWFWAQFLRKSVKYRDTQFAINPFTYCSDRAFRFQKQLSSTVQIAILSPNNCYVSAIMQCLFNNPKMTVFDQLHVDHPSHWGVSNLWNGLCNGLMEWLMK